LTDGRRTPDDGRRTRYKPHTLQNFRSVYTYVLVTALVFTLYNQITYRLFFSADKLSSKHS